MGSRCWTSGSRSRCGHQASAATGPLPLSFSVSARADEPGLARVEWNRAAQRSLLIVFRQHAVHNERDLREIFQCKMWRHSNAKGG